MSPRHAVDPPPRGAHGLSGTLHPFGPGHRHWHRLRPVKFFGVFFALGAFFAGIVLNESYFSHKAATNSLPLEDALAVLFFVSVGMLLDPYVIVRDRSWWARSSS